MLSLLRKNIPIIRRLAKSLWNLDHLIARILEEKL